MTDFNPQKTIEQIERWTGQRVRKTFYPPGGSKVTAVYIQATVNAAAINAKLADIEALADEYKGLTWTPSAIDDCRPSVDVRVTVRTDVPIPA